MQNKFAITLDEQETIIVYDYKDKMFHVYTSRKSVFNKVIKKTTYHDESKYVGAEWHIPFDDRESIYSLMGMNLYLPRKNNKS